MSARCLSRNQVERLARLALDCVEREYPSKIAHVLRSDRDVAAPRELTPVFRGCFDWHSAVHAHWMLARLCRLHQELPIAAEIRAFLARNLRADPVTIEVAYLEAEGRESFERPYGLAWLLQLAAELHEWHDPEAQAWREALRPLEGVAAQRFLRWFPRLTHPIRTGEHSQTAFAMGLIWDWASSVGHSEMKALIERRARDFHGADREAPFAYEPGGQDFLSPCLAEADLMRRVLPPGAFRDWLQRFFPVADLPADRVPLNPVRVSDPADGKLAHLDGLNLSRAWMLEGIASALSADDPLHACLQERADEHARCGLAAVTGEHYAGAHWLGSFAVYLLSGRGGGRA